MASFAAILAIGKPVAFDASALEPRHPRVHLDDDQPAGRRVDRELDVAAAGVDADRAQHGDADVAHLLVLAVGERHRRGDGDRVAGVHAHRVDVLDRADDDHVVAAVAHQLELVLLPAEHRLLDQHLVRWGWRRSPWPAIRRSSASSGAMPEPAPPMVKTGPDDDRVADLARRWRGLLDACRRPRARRLGADRADDVLEQLPVLAAVDRVDVGADQLDAVLLEHAVLVQRHRDVERGLPAEGGQQRVGRSRAMTFSTNSGVIGSM